ncbi:MAG: hypothetical protein NDI84_02785 [Steroidobacteraceae bacterium]|nr:hypothetical protein [Steroidobacteraceae bacterium]
MAKAQIEVFKRGEEGHPYPWMFAVTYDGVRHEFCGIPNHRYCGVTMNLVDCYVKEVTSEPYEAHGKWWVDVVASSWGRDSTTNVMCQTREAAEEIKVGYHFLA